MDPSNDSSSSFFSYFESLEERVLFNGMTDAEFIVSEAVDDAPNVAQVQSVDQADSVSATQLVIIDPNVENYEQLLSEVLESSGGAALEVHILDDDSDGVEQITQIFANSDQSYSAVHIISHGDEGEVNLGNSSLTSENIGSYASQLASWSSALSEDADLLFYGCDLASDTEGQQFIETISAITGADVAASDDLTGAAELGADWDLEVEVGQIDTASLSAENWDGHLNLPPTVDIDADDSGVNPGTFPDAEITSVSNTGESVTGTLGNGVNVGANFSATRGVLLGASPDIVVDVVDGTNNTISIALQDDATSPETNEAVRVAVDINPLPNTNVTSFIFRPSADVDIKAGTLTFFFEGEATLHDPDNQVSSDNDGDAVLNGEMQSSAPMP